MRHCSRNAILGAVYRNSDVLHSTHEKLSRGARCSLQLGVLRLGLLQDGDVGVGVSPQCEPTHWLRIAVLLTAFPEPARSGRHR